MSAPWRVGWVAYPFQMVGTARGYLASAWSIHRAIDQRLGARLVDGTFVAPAHPRLQLHYCPPQMFRPVPSRVNILFSMWEGPQLPQEVIAAFSRADVLIVPSRDGSHVCAQHGLDAQVVPLGVSKEFIECDAGRPIIDRPGRRSRFLFVGAQSKRKGWDLLAPAWQMAFPAPGPQELYVKTIGNGKLQQHGPLTLDQRDLEPVELLELYRSADVFVFPTRAEGFGLPALEAMAAGCLAIVPETATGMDFVSDSTALLARCSQQAEFAYGGPVFRLRVPSPQDLAAALLQAWAEWGTPELEVRRLQGIAAAREYPWERTAAGLVEALGRAQAASEARRRLQGRARPSWLASRQPGSLYGASEAGA